MVFLPLFIASIFFFWLFNKFSCI
uniref:Uncharacterized protein n=1 Tax=Rhizophora mucronata TaxID=61149 RepID=A0A2P2P6G3_RHIMU